MTIQTTATVTVSGIPTMTLDLNDDGSITLTPLLDKIHLTPEQLDGLVDGLGDVSTTFEFIANVVSQGFTE